MVIALGIGVLTAAAIYGGYNLVNATEDGHLLLIKWGFEYPGDCG